MQNNVPATTQTQNFGSLQEHVVALITEKNTDVDNGILLNKINMIIAKTPKVASMPAEVISEAVLKAMIPDPTLEDHNDIYFVPFGNKIDVSFSHNYLQKLAVRNGAVKIINTYPVYENDVVEITEKGLTYRVLPFKPQGEFVGILVDIKLANGEHKYGTVPKEHIDQARKASKSGNNGPWKSWYLEMAKKVAIKNTLKGINISREFEDAIIIDNEDTDFKQLNNPKNDTAVETLDDIMKQGSSLIADISTKLDSLGAVYEIKEDWIILNLLETELSAVTTLEGLQIDVIKKESDPTKGAIKLKDAQVLLN